MRSIEKRRKKRGNNNMEDGRKNITIEERKEIVTIISAEPI